MKILSIFMLLTMASCAKFSYVTEQGIGQLSLEWNGEDNRKVLMDPNVKEEHKEKIRKIIDYKEFFYKYYDKEETPIYGETTFLKQKAVSYLVIASPKTKIAPLMTSFPIVGEFPYLGFFKKESAEKYKKELEDRGLATYIRPVLAYTTLNKLPFYDNIISSFFYYKEQHLAETIFHELIHTVFFVKNEVDFNESMADYFGRMTSYEYYQYSPEQMQKIKKDIEARGKLMQFVASKTNELNKRYKTIKNISDAKAQEVLDSFLKDIFRPEAKALCKELKVENCWPVKHEWNNAKLAAYMTYSKEQNLLEQIHKKKNISLKKYLTYLEKAYKEYDKSDEKSFATFLKKKEQL
jgi:predicted aminopeptidase